MMHSGWEMELMGVGCAIVIMTMVWITFQLLF